MTRSCLTTLCIVFALANMRAGHRGGGGGRGVCEEEGEERLKSMHSIVESSEAVSSLQNQSGVVPYLSPVFTHRAVVPTKQDDTGYQLAKNISSSLLFTAGLLNSSSNMPTARSFVERAQGVLSCLMYHRVDNSYDILDSLKDIASATIFMSILVGFVLFCKYILGAGQL